MLPQVRQAEAKDVPTVGRFLTAGFGAAPDAEFASPEVLHWKWFDPIGSIGIPRGFVAEVQGRIVACVNLAPLMLVGGGLARELLAGERIDWLGSRDFPGSGSRVTRPVYEHVELLLGAGGSKFADKAMKKSGEWTYLPPVANYQRVLRPMHHLRSPRVDPAWAGTAKAVRDAVRGRLHTRQKPDKSMRLDRVESFGSEVSRISSSCPLPEIHFHRTPDVLNHFLRYPGKSITGWHILHEGTVRGFALLSVVRHGNRLTGKIVDCYLDSLEQELWNAAICALKGQLRDLSADVALCYATVPRIRTALEQSGFLCYRNSRFAIRDPQRLIPDNAQFYLTHLVADHAYM